MKDLELLEKMLKDNFEDLRKAESKTAKRIAKNNLRTIGKILANI